MRRLVLGLFLSILCLGVGPSWAQTPKTLTVVNKKLEQLHEAERKKALAAPDPVSLEKLIAEGLKNNPDVRVAQFRVKETELLLDRASMQLVREISVLHAEIQAAQAAVDEAQARFQLADKLFRHKAIAAEELRAATMTLAKSKRELEIIQAKMPYLLGKQISDPQGKNLPSTTSEPDSLEKRIAEGLKNNPDVRVAQSRLSEAESVLQQTRMRTAAEIARLQTDIDAAQASVNEAQLRMQRPKALFEHKVISADEHRMAMLTLARLKRELALHQAKMPYLLGKQTPKTWVELRSVSPGPGTVQFIDYYEIDNHVRRLNAAVDSLRKLTSHSQASIPGVVPKDTLKWLVDKLDASMVDKLRTALDKPITLPLNHPEGDFSLAALRKCLSENLPGISLHMHRFKHPQADTVMNSDERKLLTVKLKEPIPMGAFLQFVEDELNVIFILREYGVVMVPGERVPPGAIRVYDFWKLSKAEKRP